ncbi:MAG: presenilin family intramembrane aspartyl protease [Candidatus Diapherotrites archaeon]|nr:presenilin family intramembrane aspartyl protease [Candidatus Diapherotrites archaeon]
MKEKKPKTRKNKSKKTANREAESKKAESKTTENQKIIKQGKPTEKNLKQKENWLSPQVILLLTVVFLITQAAGLFIAKTLFDLGLQQAPFTENINDIANAAYLFGMILIMTIVLLIVLKFRRTKNLLWLVEGLAVFSTTTIVFSAFFPTQDTLVILITAIVLILRYGLRKNQLIRNAVSIIAITGAGAFIGISLGFVPIIAFITALAIYDIIAVFYTKHMVTIGKEVVKNNFAFTIAFPTKKHKFELGNGDLVIPLMVASSILVNGPFKMNSLVAGLCLVASFIGLLLSIYSVSKWKRAMPALPPQTALMIIVLVIAFLAGA